MKTNPELIQELQTQIEKLQQLVNELEGKGDEIKPFEVNLQSAEKMIFIARGHAPDGLEDKCFGLSMEHTWELSENDGYQILIPTKR